MQTSQFNSIVPLNQVNKEKNFTEYWAETVFLNQAEKEREIYNSHSVFVKPYIKGLIWAATGETRDLLIEKSMLSFLR